MRDHLVLGITSLMIRRSLLMEAWTALRADTRTVGEGPWAQTTRFEAEVHFAPTTLTCENLLCCKGRS
jgi:hypothetical protein